MTIGESTVPLGRSETVQPPTEFTVAQRLSCTLTLLTGNRAHNVLLTSTGAHNVASRRRFFFFILTCKQHGPQPSSFLTFY
ncbi:hypothetical protein B9Z55_023321 [Caenorhabditis nigoni]|uniref:Uncharacterized protein n=1 Tax=Caenorhabditis nigoni TaxID=1611254 RepID=A0A2G5SP20_9PELO|nr:hypothetical protein B9Z55_023321 [Caenorhabditis nigoni]